MSSRAIRFLGIGVLLLVCLSPGSFAVAYAQAPPVMIDLNGALTRARANSQQYLSAMQDTQIAHEDIKQARSALLPKASVNNQYIYSQGNGANEARFIGANGVHEFSNQGVVEENISQSSRLQVRSAVISEAIAKAKEDVTRRGLAAVVVQNYYALVSAQRHLVNATQSLAEARGFLDSTKKLEANGEVAHRDVVSAQSLPLRRQIEVNDAGFEIEKAQVELAVLIFPDYSIPFTVNDDLDSLPPLSEVADIRSQAAKNSPDLLVATKTLQQQTLGVAIAKSEFMPSMTFDYFYGIDANRFAFHTDGRPNLGSSVQATLNIPVFNWGATRSRIRQADARKKQAELELTRTTRELNADVQLLYREAQFSRSQLDLLKASVDQAADNERLTRLAYAAGEVSVLEIVDAQRTLTEARDAYDAGLARYQVAWAKIQVATGVF